MCHVAGALITAVFYGLNVSFQPYATSSLNRTQATTLVSLFLNLFLGVLLCLSRYMDLERQQTCKNENDDNCAKWKGLERIVVEVIVTVITISVPFVPVFNFLLSENVNEVKGLSSFLFKSKEKGGEQSGIHNDSPNAQQQHHGDIVTIT